MPESQRKHNLYHLYCDAQAPPMPPQRLQQMRAALLAEYQRVFSEQEPCSRPP